MYCTPIAIESITQKLGGQEKSLPVPKANCSRAMSQKTADTVNSLLKGVIDSGTGQQAGLSDRDSAGKTGTTDARKNAWFVGYTPNMAGAVWVGSASQQVQMTNIRIGGVFHPLVYGADVPGPIWRDAMTGALQGASVQSFNLVDIPDRNAKATNKAKDKDKDKDHGQHQHDGKNGGAIGGFVGGLTDGGTGTDGGATFPGPGGFVQGQTGGTHGNNNGGQRG
jgi:membrane peptidoglycan carboxypeptidase